MNYSQFILQKRTFLFNDTFLLYLRPTHGKVFHFSPGQYITLKNPFYLSHEEHPFSIASSPETQNAIELCIKVYGDWTHHLMQFPEGRQLFVSQPMGNFIWKNNLSHAVFLLGGIGISPIMSMLRFLKGSKYKPKSITMFYGNRTIDTVAYRNELMKLQQSLPLKIVNIYSHLSDNHPWQGYRGFITDEIIKKEVDISVPHTFFIVGPPIFIEKMQHILKDFSTPQENIKLETISLVK